jgi:hypothetical protein
VNRKDYFDTLFCEHFVTTNIASTKTSTSTAEKAQRLIKTQAIYIMQLLLDKEKDYSSEVLSFSKRGESKGLY